MKYVEADFRLSPCTGDFCDILSALLAEEANFETFEETETGLRGYVQQTLFQPEQLAETIAAFPLPDVHIDYTVTEAEDRNWNKEWEKNGFAPLHIGEHIYIHDSRYPANPDARYDIKINPQQAFGTGSHQTTGMILQHLLHTHLTNKRVLDAGCGTGILSILASMLQAREVFAYDIDEWSVRNTLENLALNGITNVEVQEGDAAVLKTQAPFDVVLANINRNILLHDFPAFFAVMKPDARIIISGFYTEDIPLLTEAAATYGWQLETSDEQNGWAMLAFHG